MIDRTWTLFLDRDGVLNRRLPEAYVRHPDQFDFLPGVLDALPVLSARFGRLIVLTNQQGIGKGLMTEADLEQVHRYMQAGVEGAGGRLDGIYYCPHLASAGCPCRKPNPGLALQAKADFPSIAFERSVLVGDSASDIQLGQRLGMLTAWVRHPEDDRAMSALPDLTIGGLPDLWPALRQ